MIDSLSHNNTYKRMYPTRVYSPEFYGLPKIHEKDIPVRPKLSSKDLVTYGVVKELGSILQPLVGSPKHHIQNMQNFMESFKDIKLEPGECITLYDVTALFTSVLVRKSLP